MSDKEFPPSIRRLQRARKEGKVVKSRMVSLAVSWWCLSLALFPSFAWVRNGSLVQWLNYKVWAPQVALTEACWLGARVIGLLVGVVALSSFAVGMAQTRCLFIPAQLFRGIEQYRPGAFLGRVKESSIDAFLGMLRCCLVLVLVAPLVFQVMQIVPSAFQGSEDAASDALYTVTRSVFLRSGYGLLVIAVIAYVLARWRFFKQLRMSLQELRDEYRDDEGDPHTKAARKHEHRNILFSEVEKRVKSSKVVIVRRVTEKK